MAENNEATSSIVPETDANQSGSEREITSVSYRPDSAEHLFTRRQDASGGLALHNTIQSNNNNLPIPRRCQPSTSNQMVRNGVTGRSRVRIDTCNTQNRVGSGTSRRSLAETEISDNDNDDDQDDDRFLIPVLPLEISVICCVLNFIFPGLGTVIAGFSVLCCGRPSDITKRQSCGSCLATIGIGILQLLMVSCFLIGWVWSGIWGVSLVSMSMDYYKEDPGTGSHWRRPRRPRSTLIYPLRARSNTRYHSPPPPYQMYSSPPPGYYAPDEDLEEAARIAGTDVPSDSQEPSQRVVLTAGREVRTYWQCNVCRKQNESGDQKFKCRRCFETVCNDCYNKHVTAPSGQKIIVCDLCYGEVGLSLTTPGYPDLGLPTARTDGDTGLNVSPSGSSDSVHDTL